MTADERKSVMKALLKRAVGYHTEETVDEYSAGEGGEPAFVKRRTTDKDVPGDVAAARLLLELDGQMSGELGSMTDEELLKLKDKLEEELKQWTVAP